jgi:hypothetical protein
MFSQGGAVVGAALKLNGGSIRDGPLAISAGWQKGVAEDTIVEVAVDELLVSTMYNMCSGRLEIACMCYVAYLNRDPVRFIKPKLMWYCLLYLSHDHGI